MFNSFIKTAFRFFWRNKSYTILNYLCITFGLTCSIVAALNVKRVIGYDRFHENYNRLFEVEAHVTYFNGDRFPKEYLSASLTDLVKASVPEIESLVRVTNTSFTIKKDNESFQESGIYADPHFLEVFSFPLISGQKERVLNDNNSIVVSERLAIKFFETTDCIGKTLLLANDRGEEGFTVSGIMKDIPNESSLQFSFIIPFSKFLAGNSEALESGASSAMIWALLSKNADAGAANAKLKDLIKGQETTLNQELFLFPLKEKVLYTYAGGKRVWSEMQNIVIIGSIGLAILLIACFNFINLAIAMNIRRYREAGIKKVVGAQKSTIIIQHLGEAFILIFISLLTAIDLARLAVNGLNRMLNGNVHFNFSDIGIILIFAGIALFTTLVSGLLPALYLSSSNPVNILKGKIVTGHSFSAFRQGLIVFQFTIPIFVIICMMIIKTQDDYLRNFDMGFDKDKLLIVPASTDLEAHSESIRSELLSIPGIESVSFTNCIPARGAKVTNEVSWEGKDAASKLHFWRVNTDFSYDHTVNLAISDGRYFDQSHPSDSSCYLINDVAAKVMGYEDPVGRSLTLDGKNGTIIGVFRNFHALDLRGPYTPTIISVSAEGRNSLLVKFSSGTFSSLNEKIKTTLNKYETDEIFQGYLYSDILKRTELTTISMLAGLAFFISILLACMGLSGLASFTAESRTKEIGIRKINGASIFSILRLLGLNYTRWLLIATCIAIPFAFILGTFFLSRFNFRTSMPYPAFLIGPAIACVIALLTVGVQSWRAGNRNPVDALRYE
ncbi:MAG: ABC transporter permease [Chloroflexota bacterium]